MTKETIPNFIEGKFVEPIGGNYLDNIEPATARVYSQVADSDSRDVEAAVGAAATAFVEWSRTTAAERSCILLSIADFIERALEKFARAESIDTGKPISLARSRLRLAQRQLEESEGAPGSPSCSTAPRRALRRPSSANSRQPVKSAFDFLLLLMLLIMIGSFLGRSLAMIRSMSRSWLAIAHPVSYSPRVRANCSGGLLVAP